MRGLFFFQGTLVLRAASFGDDTVFHLDVELIHAMP